MLVNREPDPGRIGFVGDGAWLEEERVARLALVSKRARMW